jgi:hypothetical protein
MKMLRYLTRIAIGTHGSQTNTPYYSTLIPKCLSIFNINPRNKTEREGCILTAAILPVYAETSHSVRIVSEVVAVRVRQG